MPDLSRPPLTRRERREIVERWQAGESSKTLAHVYHRSWRMIQDVLREFVGMRPDRG